MVQNTRAFGAALRSAKSGGHLAVGLFPMLAQLAATACEADRVQPAGRSKPSRVEIRSTAKLSAFLVDVLTITVRHRTP